MIGPHVHMGPIKILYVCIVMYVLGKNSDKIYPKFRVYIFSLNYILFKFFFILRLISPRESCRTSKPVPKTHFPRE